MGWGWRRVGDTQACGGLALRTPEEGWPFTPGCHAPHASLHFPPPPHATGSTTLSPELPLLPSSRLRGGCRPPERPRAAWAAGGASCEAAGRGLGCGLLRRPSCFSEVQLPLPSHPPSAPTSHRTPSPSAWPSLSSPGHSQPGNLVSESTQNSENLREARAGS